MDDKETSPAKAPADSLWRLVARNAGPIARLSGTGKDALPVYCVHSIFGDVADLRNVAEPLGSEQSVYGIQVPRERMNGDFAASIEAMARFYLDALVAFQPEGPLVLAGWSAGAIVALEMAQQLRAMGRDIPLIIAFDGAPCNTGAGLSPWNPLYALKVIANLPGWLRYDAQHDWSLKGIVRRIDSKLTIRFRRKAPALKATQTLDGEVVWDVLESKNWLPGQRDFVHGFYGAAQRYVAKPYAGDVLVYETTTQPLYHLRQIGAAWRKLAATIEVVALPSNHTLMFFEPQSSMITAHLRGRLAALRGEPRDALVPTRASSVVRLSAGGTLAGTMLGHSGTP